MYRRSTSGLSVSRYGSIYYECSHKHLTVYSKLFQKQGEYFDIPTQDLSIRQIRENLASLASEVLSDAQAVEKVKDLLQFKGSPNGGNAVTDDLKYTGMYRATSTLQSKGSQRQNVHFLSQVCETKWDPCVADGTLGRHCRQPDRKLLGREGLGRVFLQSNHGLDSYASPDKADCTS